MLQYEKSYIVLMVQSAHVVFCYYNISPMNIKEFEDTYGQDSWKNSRLTLKVYEKRDEEAKEIETIYLDKFADNWYINLNRANLDVFVKLGKMLPSEKFVSIVTSNIVTTPRDEESENKEVHYINLGGDNVE